MNGENGSENQATIGTYGSLLMDSMWTSIPCVDLLALADAAFTTKGSGGGLGGQCGGDSQQEGGGSRSQTDGVKYLFDLNSPPAVTEPQLISTLPPITPKQTRRVVRKRVVSDILNSDIDGRTGQTPASLEQSKPVIEQSQDDIWQLEVNDDFDEESTSSDELLLLKTPKPKRRKHRPKVVKEGQPKKSTTLKPKGSSTGKSKNFTPEKSTVRPVRNSCRRKIYFEEENMYEKAF
ncbi:uncharacterized protein LOC143617888 [Bidens hawaiensis]|uniref:uncharacterized protein LOC143617888 n=1 Tax=Bidens hawaiensis TaxID=980011 RepID=UPI00404993CB